MFDIFGGGSDGTQAYEDALKEAQQTITDYYNKAIGYMQPYYDAGTNALSQYQAALTGMSNPQQFYQSIMSGYTTSPQAQQQMQQQIDAANAAGAASGMLGSGAEQTALEQQAQQITAADQQQYFNNMMSIFNKYLSGEAGLESQGYGAAGQMGNWGMGAASDIASLQTSMGQAQAQQAQQAASGLASFTAMLAPIMMM